MINELAGPKNFQSKVNNVTWINIYPDLKKAAFDMKKWKDMPGVKVYDKRMYVCILLNAFL